MSLAERVWNRSTDGRIQWLTMENRHMDGALAVMKDSFLKNESVCVVTRLLQRPEAVRLMLLLCTVIAQDGASVVAVEKATGKVVGVAFNKISNKGSISFLGRMREEPGIDAGYAELIDFVRKVEEKVDVFQHYKAESVLDLMFLATDQDYYRQGIGLGLVAATVNLAKGLKSIQAVIAIFTGYASQKIGRNLSWDTLADIPYDSITYEGERYSDRLGRDIQSSIFMGFRV